MFQTCPIHGSILLSACGRFDAPCGACDDDLSRGFDAGNYASAYETDDLDAALESPSADGSEAFRTAFILGFYSSYEIEEMGPCGAEQYETAYASAYGKRCQALGYVQGEQDYDDHNQGEAAF